jgi:PadR family transcriptional regulator, regulatory protein PadR
MCKTTYVKSKEQQFPRLSSKETLILDLLTAQGPMYGLQLVSGSKGKLKRGTVYVTLGRMEQKGLIFSGPERLSDNSGLVPRRVYRPTAFGVRVLDIWKRLGRELSLEFAQ